MSWIATCIGALAAIIGWILATLDGNTDGSMQWLQVLLLFIVLLRLIEDRR